MIRAVHQQLAGVLAGALTIVSLLPAAAGAGPAGKAKGQPAQDQDIERLRHAEQIWARALETGDPALLETIIDDEFSFIGPDGEYEDRATYLGGYRALPSQGIKVEKIDMDQVKLRVLGDTGLVTGHVLAKVKLPAQTIVEDVRFTRVYRRHGEAWRMVAGRGTRLPRAGAK
jgi:ketosteroid isomerase-like protein